MITQWHDQFTASQITKISIYYPWFKIKQNRNFAIFKILFGLCEDQALKFMIVVTHA